MIAIVKDKGTIVSWICMIQGENRGGMTDQKGGGNQNRYVTHFLMPKASKISKSDQFLGEKWPILAF